MQDFNPPPNCELYRLVLRISSHQLKENRVLHISARGLAPRMIHLFFLKFNGVYSLSYPSSQEICAPHFGLQCSDIEMSVFIHSNVPTNYHQPALRILNPQLNGNCASPSSSCSIIMFLNHHVRFINFNIFPIISQRRVPTEYRLRGLI